MVLKSHKFELKFSFPSSESDIIDDECRNKHVTAFCKLFLLRIAFLSPHIDLRLIYSKCDIIS